MSPKDQDLSELWSCLFNGPLPILAGANLVLSVLVRCMPLAPPYTVAVTAADDCRSRTVDHGVPTAESGVEARLTEGSAGLHAG